MKSQASQHTLLAKALSDRRVLTPTHTHTALFSFLTLRPASQYNMPALDLPCELTLTLLSQHFNFSPQLGMKIVGRFPLIFPV